MSLDLPEVPPPPPPRPALGKPITIVSGCAIGCGALLVCGLIGMFALAFALPPLFAPTVRLYVSKQYTKAQDAKKYTAAQLEVYGDIKDSVDTPEVNFYVASLAYATMHEHLKDGVLTDEEITQAGVLRDFLNENPKAGMFAVQKFGRDHPEFKAIMNQNPPPVFGGG